MGVTRRRGGLAPWGSHEDAPGLRHEEGALAECFVLWGKRLA